MRHLRQFTQKDLAERTKRTQARVSLVEGKGDPQLSTILALADALRVELIPVPLEHIAEVDRLLGRKSGSRSERVPTAFDELFIDAGGADEDVGSEDAGSKPKP